MQHGAQKERVRTERAERQARRPLHAVHIIAVLLVMLSTACGTIPSGRYGIRTVNFEGMEDLDSEVLRACLGMQQRAYFSLRNRVEQACNEPPFDQPGLVLYGFAWPWSSWPLFDENVFARDIERIERWYRARGYYDANVVTANVDPPEALLGSSDEETNDRSLDITFQIEEGEPIRVADIDLSFDDEMDPDLEQALRGALTLNEGERFDETFFDQSRERLVRTLGNRGFAQAEVEGEVKINRERRRAHIRYLVHRGPRTVYGAICVRGYEALAPERVIHASDLVPGQPFSLRGLDLARNTLFRLGVFANVQIDLIEADDNTPEAPDTESPEYCSARPTSLPDGVQPVDIRIRISFGQAERFGIGVGMQVGQSAGLGNNTIISTDQNAAQWDLHLALSMEHRNLFDTLLRGQLEVRPRVVFRMPIIPIEAAQDPPVGLLANGSLSWPAFIGPLSDLVLRVRNDLGPMPITGVWRNAFSGSFGIDHTFLFETGSLNTELLVHGSHFLPTDGQPERLEDQVPTTWATWLEGALSLDLRDDSTQPTSGFFSEMRVQQGTGSWTFLRAMADFRGYIPLPLGIVLAGRARFGMMWIQDFNRGDLGEGTPGSRYSAYGYHETGPPALQLVGGGSSGNRGFLPGYLGDVTQRYVTQPRSNEELANGDPVSSRPILLPAGNTLWEASIELRLPLTSSIGMVIFADAGDLRRSSTLDFRLFQAPQLAFGLGFRYHTFVGPIRLDLAFRPDQLQSWLPARMPGSNDQGLPTPCEFTAGVGHDCRPVARWPIAETMLPMVLHITLGESF